MFVLFCVFMDDLSHEFLHAHARACEACMHTRTHAHVHTAYMPCPWPPRVRAFACICSAVHVHVWCVCCAEHTHLVIHLLGPNIRTHTHTCIHDTSHPSPATRRLNTAAKGPARKSSGPRKQQIRVTEEVAAKLKAKAAGANVPVSDIVEDILMTALTK